MTTGRHGIRHSISLSILVLAVVCVTGAAFASTTHSLRPGAERSLPEIELIANSEQRAQFVFELPALEIETYQVEGETFQSVSFARGELHGEVGAPALPAFTRYVAIPAEAAATVRVLGIEEEYLDEIHLLPMQALEGDTFAYDRAAYAHDEFLGGELVSVGAPALWRDLRVVPVTFRPIQHNAARRELRVARRIEVTVDFAGQDLRNVRTRERVPLTREYDRLYRSLVINYGDGSRSGEPAPTLGTYLVIARDNSTLLDKLEPLLEWRRKMGYNVVLATTSQTGTSSTTIKNYIQDLYDTMEYPPEYILMAGDASGSFPLPAVMEPWSGYGGYGDHFYVELAGNDHLPDAFIGRLSAEDYNTMELIVNKILGYESTPAMGNPNWFESACLVGDPDDSGYTCVMIQQWLKERLLEQGFTRANVDTIWDGPFVSSISSFLNYHGATYFGYRGYWGMSGWGTDDIYNLSNGWELPFAINITCGTGTFTGGSLSVSEAWLRAGNPPNSPRGGIGSIGTATLGTHTRYNNCFYAGSAYGLFCEGHYKLGKALARGKLEMWLSYGEAAANTAATWCYWNNLMGDPATELWTAPPEPLTVTYASTVPRGSNLITVQVRDSASQPLANAWVFLRKGSQILIGDYTDEAGQVALPVEATATGWVSVTVTGHNLHPHQGGFTIAQEDQFVAGHDYLINDSGPLPIQGNGNGTLNPTETVGLRIYLENFGTADAPDVVLTAACDDPYIKMIDGGPIHYGTIPAGTSQYPPGAIVIELLRSAPDDHLIDVDLDVQSGAAHWISRLRVPVVAPNLVFRQVELGREGERINPGQTEQLLISLENAGGLTAAGPIDAYLISDSYALQVTDPEGTYAMSIDPGNYANNTSNPFAIYAPSDCVPGQLAPLRLALTFADGLTDTAALAIQVGTADSHDPTGPDRYGYYAFDHTDTSYPQAPAYDYVDITGVGSPVGLSDMSYQQYVYDEDSEVVDLPFDFTFYGETFDRATICSNGWMSFGATILANYYNWHLPSAEGPAYMLAPFWDNLYFYYGGVVYHWYDAAQHRYIVAWDDVRNEEGTRPYERFEVILYDPAYYPTYTGDGEVVFQFAEINDVDGTRMYSTCGIQNGDHTDGITFSYYARQPATAATFNEPLAIKFTTAGPGAAEVTPRRPRLFFLGQNEPNPCQSATSFRFGLEQEAPVMLRIFDVDGRLVRTLWQGRLSGGEHTLEWGGHNDQGHLVPAGVYFYTLQADEQTATRKMLRLR